MFIRAGAKIKKKYCKYYLVQINQIKVSIIIIINRSAKAQKCVIIYLKLLLKLYGLENNETNYYYYFPPKKWMILPVYMG